MKSKIFSNIYGKVSFFHKWCMKIANFGNRILYLKFMEGYLWLSGY
jgi:hypothetical protein